MSVDATRWAWQQKTGKSSIKLILLSMADRAGEDFTCFPSIERLAKDTELNRKTVIAGINRLEKLGLLRDTGERKGSTKQVKVYKLVGVPDRNSTESGTIKTVPKTESLNSTEKGIVSPETVPILDGKSPKNGTLKSPKNGTQNLSVEPTSINQSLCSEQKNVVFRLPLNVKKTFHEVTTTQIAAYAELYPAVDIEQQYRKMIGWLNANPKRRKTKTGVEKFINNWLTGEQDKGKNHGNNTTRPAAGQNLEITESDWWSTDF